MEIKRILQLLIDEAPTADFDAYFRPITTTNGSSAAVNGDLHEIEALAVRMRGLSADHRRRESELTALYATARDLISMRDLSAVLRAIVGRARSLIGADASYLTLNDRADGVTFMGVTEGVVTEKFQTLRLPFGIGLGGLVAKSATPYFTSDYLQDDRFDHVELIDECVDEEQIRAILGVPMQIRDETVGVLFTANRRLRTYTPDEVNLLISLASLAAVAIENVRLFEKAEQALCEVEASSEHLAIQARAISRAEKVHERFVRVALHGGTMRDIVDVLARGLSGDVWVLDDYGAVIESSLDESFPTDAEALVARARQDGRTLRDESGESFVWATPIASNADALGSLVFRSNVLFEDPDHRTLERGAQSLGLLLLRDRAISEAELRIRGEFLEDLLTRRSAVDTNTDAVVRRAHKFGLDFSVPHTVVVASAPKDGRATLLKVANRLADAEHGISAQRGNSVIIVLPLGKDETLIRLRANLESHRNAGITAGIAHASRGDRIPDAFEEAESCRRALVTLGHEGEIATDRELGVFGLLLSPLGRETMDAYIDSTIGPILTYDHEKGAELRVTLLAFFNASGNMSRAASDLHVHTNTLYQRCDRISALIGPDWRSPQASLQIQIALQAHHLRETLPTL